MGGEEDSTSDSSPSTFSEAFPKWLDSALEYGLLEDQFWDMTLLEIERYLNACRRRLKAEQKERAYYDYVLADLIGKSVARIHSKKRYPEIYKVYPSLFTKEEIEDKKQEAKDELSAARFRQFAHSFNNSFKEVKKRNE